MAAIEEQYMQALSLIRLEFEHERELMSECHKREIERVRDIIFAMNQNFQENDNESKQDFQSMRDEAKNKVTYNYCAIQFFSLLFKKNFTKFSKIWPVVTLTPNLNFYYKSKIYFIAD